MKLGVGISLLVWIASGSVFGSTFTGGQFQVIGAGYDTGYSDLSLGDGASFYRGFEVEAGTVTISANGTWSASGLEDAGSGIWKFFDDQLALGDTTEEGWFFGWVTSTQNKFVSFAFEQRTQVNEFGPFVVRDKEWVLGVRPASGLTPSDLLGEWLFVSLNSYSGGSADPSESDFFTRDFRVESITLNGNGTFDLVSLASSEDNTNVNGTWSTGGSNLIVTVPDLGSLVFDAVSADADVIVVTEDDSEGTTVGGEFSILVKHATDLVAGDLLGDWILIEERALFRNFREGGPSNFFLQGDRLISDLHFNADGTLDATLRAASPLADDVVGETFQADWAIQGGRLVVSDEDGSSGFFAVSAAKDFILIFDFENTDSGFTEQNVLILIRPYSEPGLEQFTSLVGASQPSFNSNQVTFETFLEAGVRYQLQRTDDFIDWIDVGEPVNGTGDTGSQTITIDRDSDYYRWLILP